MCGRGPPAARVCPANSKSRNAPPELLGFLVLTIKALNTSPFITRRVAVPEGRAPLLPDDSEPPAAFCAPAAPEAVDPFVASRPARIVGALRVTLINIKSPMPAFRLLGPAGLSSFIHLPIAAPLLSIIFTFVNKLIMFAALWPGPP